MGYQFSSHNYVSSAKESMTYNVCMVVNLSRHSLESAEKV